MFLSVINARYDADDQIIDTVVFMMASWWHDEFHLVLHVRHAIK